MVEAPKKIEIPEIVEGKVSGQAFEKVSQALLDNPVTESILAKDKVDPRSVMDFELDKKTYSLSFWHQDSQANLNERTSYLTLVADGAEGKKIINIASTYYRNSEGNRLYTGAGRLRLTDGEDKYYGQDALDRLEPTFPSLFLQKS